MGVPCSRPGCTHCIPVPEAEQAKSEPHRHIPGYYGTDPDGHAYFQVSTRYAGYFGENLRFIHTPHELEGSCPTLS